MNRMMLIENNKIAFLQSHINNLFYACKPIRINCIFVIYNVAVPGNRNTDCSIAFSIRKIIFYKREQFSACFSFFPIKLSFEPPLPIIFLPVIGMSIKSIAKIPANSHFAYNFFCTFSLSIKKSFIS